eukprot:g55603.t1
MCVIVQHGSGVIYWNSKENPFLSNLEASLSTETKNRCLLGLRRGQQCSQWSEVELLCFLSATLVRHHNKQVWAKFMKPYIVKATLST